MFEPISNLTPKAARALCKAQMEKARQSKRFKRSQTQKLRKSYISKSEFVHALGGTGGLYTKLGYKLGCMPTTVKRHLERPDWEDMRALWLEEIGMVTDEAKRTVLYAMTQRLDVATALRAAQWYLSKVERQTFGDNTSVTVQGGDQPVRVAHLHLPVDVLDKPLDIRRQIMELIESQDNGTPLLDAKVG